MSFASIPGGSFVLNDGHRIPFVGFGTFEILADQVSSAVDAALGAGYRLFDTAHYYENESELGQALQKHLSKHNLTRKDVYITTKFHLHSGNAKQGARKSVKLALEKLQTDYIDLVLIHFPKALENDDNDKQNAVDRKEAYLELVKIRDEGLIHSLGVSNYEINHIEEIRQYSKVVPAVNQVEFHPHFTRNALRKYCQDNGIFFQAFTSLGRQHPDLIGDPDVLAIAKAHNTTPQLVLLKWAVQLNVGIVPKSVSAKRIAENFRVVDVHLTAEEVKRLEGKNRDANYTPCEGWKVL